MASTGTRTRTLKPVDTAAARAQRPAPRGYPCHSHGPGRFPSSWAMAPAPSKPPASPSRAAPRLRTCAPTRSQVRARPARPHAAVPHQLRAGAARALCARRPARGPRHHRPRGPPAHVLLRALRGPRHRQASRGVRAARHEARQATHAAARAVGRARQARSHPRKDLKGCARRKRSSAAGPRGAGRGASPTLPEPRARPWHPLALDPPLLGPCGL